MAVGLGETQDVLDPAHEHRVALIHVELQVAEQHDVARVVGGEELIQQLKKNYTIVIVTHNMQQAARVSDYTAFFYLGELIEMNHTAKIFTNPGQKRTEDYVTGRFG